MHLLQHSQIHVFPWEIRILLMFTGVTDPGLLTRAGTVCSLDLPSCVSDDMLLSKLLYDVLNTVAG